VRLDLSAAAPALRLELRGLLAAALGPGSSPEEALAAYAAPGLSLHGLRCAGALAGLLGLRRAPGAGAVILHLAVAPDLRGQGLGRALLRAAVAAEGLRQLVAETDAEAVGFYRACGFVVTSLGERHPGVERFRCVWTAGEGAALLPLQEVADPVAPHEPGPPAELAAQARDVAVQGLRRDRRPAAPGRVDQFVVGDDARRVPDQVDEQCVLGRRERQAQGLPPQFAQPLVQDHPGCQDGERHGRRARAPARGAALGQRRGPGGHGQRQHGHHALHPLHTSA